MTHLYLIKAAGCRVAGLEVVIKCKMVY